MGRVFMFGLVCAAFAFVNVMVGGYFNLGLQNVLFGLACGAVLGLVRTHSPLARVSAFLIGLIFGLAFYLLRLALLPGTTLGLAIAVVVVIMLLTTISALTKDRLPLWAMLLGTLAFVGAYNGYYLATPWLFETQVVSTTSALLLSFAAGFFVTLLVELRVKRGGVDRVSPMEPGGPAPAAPVLPPQPAPAASAHADAGISVLSTPASAPGRPDEPAGGSS